VARYCRWCAKWIRGDAHGRRYGRQGGHRRHRAWRQAAAGCEEDTTTQLERRPETSLYDTGDMTRRYESLAIEEHALEREPKSLGGMEAVSGMESKRPLDDGAQPSWQAKHLRQRPVETVGDCPDDMLVVDSGERPTTRERLVEDATERVDIGTPIVPSTHDAFGSAIGELASQESGRSHCARRERRLGNTKVREPHDSALRDENILWTHVPMKDFQVATAPIDSVVSSVKSRANVGNDPHRERPRERPAAGARMKEATQGISVNPFEDHEEYPRMLPQVMHLADVGVPNHGGEPSLAQK